MYTNIETKVQMRCTRTEPFAVKVGVHQGSKRSRLMFALMMNEETKDSREVLTKKMLYANNLVLLDYAWKEVESKMHYKTKQ